ncbi:MAG TPA: PAS domain S-box protein [Chloroflexota bacterium]
MTTQSMRDPAPLDQQNDFSLAVFGAKDGLWDWDIRTDTVAFSARWKTMLGYDEDELGPHFSEWQSRVHPDDQDRALATLEAYLAGETPFYELEHRVRHKDGSYRWVLARGMALWDEQGEPYRLAGSHTDITTRKEAEEQLRASEALYRALVNTSPDSIVVTDLGGRIVMANSRAAQLYGYGTTEEMIGLDALHMIAPEERERAEHDLHSAARQGCLRDREYTHLRRDGTRFPAEASAALITDTDGQSRALISVTRDVSERKHAEKRLRERDEQYRSIFEATSDGIIINDLDGVVVEANPAACAMHGYTREEFIGLHRTAYVHPDYHDALPGYIETIAANGSVHARGVNTRKDGCSFPVEIHGSEFVYWGKPRILALVRDVTEQVQAQDLLEKRVMERTRELFTLLEVSRQVASTLRIEPLISVILEQLKGVVDYEGGSLLKRSGEDLVIVEYQGPNSREEVVGLRFPLSRIEPIWELAQQGQPIMICDVRGDSLLARTFYEAAGPLMDGIWKYVRSWMGVPLVQKGKTIGLLSLSIDVPNFYSDQQAHLALAFASQAAAAMENARLYAQAQDAAVLEERARLARELHDSVTQSLFSMTMHAEAAKVSLERESEWVNVPAGARALRNLRQLAELTEGALAEMRALIFELRPGALQEEGLGAALQNHAGALSAREGLPIEVQVPDVRVQAEPSIEEHLYRFAQEALHNVVKHAGASHAVVRLRAEENGRLVLEIEDDGTGFDPARVPAGHLGLRTMADRVEQIGGTTEIQSVPLQGTLVRAVTSAAS